MNAIRSLLGLKRWREDEAKNRFALLLRDLGAEEKRLAHMEGQFKSVSGRLEFKADEPVDIGEIGKLNEYLGHLGERIRRQKKVIEGKERRVEEARNNLVDATKERKIFERLDEKQREAMEKEYRRKEQIRTDEHAATRHRRHER